MKAPARFLLAALAITIALLAIVWPTQVRAAASCGAPAPKPSASPSAVPSGPPNAAALADAQLKSEDVKSEEEIGQPLYQMGDEIFTIDRDGTLFYYFQGNRDGTAKVKREMRYGRNLWNDCAQLRIRIPFVTRYPVIGNTYSGLSNIELGYSYNVKSTPFDHSLEFRIALPTAVNNVDSLDTQLKGFYTTKWKQPGWAISYTNEYDQTIIRPPGSSYTSYYEGKVQLPDYILVPEVPGMKLSAFYNYRVLFDSGGIVKDALGGTLFGSINDVALSVTDSWGLGENALWKYKFEANATVRL